MKAKTFKLVSLIVALLAAVILTVGYVFAWFFDSKNAEFTINGKSAGAYFDSGDGSEEKPFVIANPTHMHNLAVLQNTGKFTVNGVQKQYYFEIKKTIDEIDMTEMYMPPIGNDEFPFIGIFNGNGKTVSNLVVTTNKSLLGDNYPVESSADYEFSRAVGLFGMTGDVSDISNVILENPLVDVANTNTKYLSADDGAIKAAQQVAGIAIGFVAGKCSSIGVRAVNTGATLHLKVNGYSTFNSILGALGDNVSSAVTGGGHTNGTGGSGANFGASFDIPQLADRLVAIGKNKKSDTPSWLLPDMDYQSDIPVPVAGEKVPFSVSGYTEENYVVGPDAVEQTSNLNIGYFLGNQNKVDNKDITAVAEMTLNGDVWEMSGSGNYIAPKWFYEFKDSNGSYSTGNMQATFNKANFNPLSKEAFDALPQNVKDFLPEKVGDTKNYDCIILRQTFTNNAPIFSWDKSHWSYHGQVSYMGKTYGEGFRKVFDELDYAVDENGYRYTSDGNKLDENGYMFKDNVDGANFYIGYNWPLSNNFDDDGYFIDEAGNRYFDTEGEAIKGFGYARAYNGTEYYPVKESGERLALVNEWGYKINLSFRTGQGVRYQDYTNGIFLPNSAIWFKPSVEGKLRFIMWTPSANCGFTLGKITRTSGTADNPFKVNYNDSGTFDSASSFKTEELIKVQNLPVKVFVYYEIDVTEDVKAGNVEYMLMEYGSNGARFLYLDMGSSAAEDTSGIDREKSVSAVDFIYDGVEIKQGNPADDAADAAIKVGDFIVKTSGDEEALYESSKTSVYFENLSTVFKLVFLRLHAEDGKHSGKTICLEQSNPVPDTSSDIKATFATYVCPTIGGGSGTVSGGGGGGGTVTPTPGPDDEVTETSVNFKTIYDATEGTADSNGRKDIAEGTTYGNITFNGGKISEDSYNNQTNTFAVKLNSSTNSIKLVGTGASGSGATVSIVITDASGNEVGRSSQEAASNEEVSLTINNLAAGAYTVNVVKTNQSGSGSVKFTEISVTDGTSGTVTPTPDPNPDVETVNDYIDISTDTNESGHSISFTSESGYFSVQGVGNYKYSTVLGGALIGTSTGRGLKITAGDNLESIKFTIKLGISDDSKYNASSKSSTAEVTGAKTATLESESGNVVYEYEVTLNAGETITITGARNLALVEITAVVTPQS